MISYTDSHNSMC